MMDNKKDNVYLVSTNNLFEVLGVVDLDKREDFINRFTAKMISISEKIMSNDPTYRVAFDRFVDNDIADYLTEELGNPIYTMDYGLVYEMIDRARVVAEVGVITRHIQSILDECGSITETKCFIGGVILYGRQI